MKLINTACKVSGYGRQELDLILLYIQSVINMDFINNCMIVISWICEAYLFSDGVTQPPHRLNKNCDRNNFTPLYFALNNFNFLKILLI